MPVKCMECGKVFRLAYGTKKEATCPKCGSVDVDIIVKDYR